MNYWLHPDAAAEHREQVGYYEERQPGLGRRYHAEFQATLARICEAPQRARLAHPPAIRRLGLHVFHFDVIYRIHEGSVQVLAVSHQRRQPGYWLDRL